MTDPNDQHDTTTHATSAISEESTMLLSRTAESIYWTGRYLERAESTARIVRAHTELFLDLPKAAGLGWSPLLVVTGSGADFAALGGPPDEERVISFLVADRRNPGSIVASLRQARENLRTCRSVIPREAWEACNELQLTAAETCDTAVLRHGRSGWMGMVIGDVQRVNGILNGTMAHDDAYAFLQMGQQIERADMTSRVLDVWVASLAQAGGDQLSTYADVQWMSMLKSLSAHQMYRRTMQSRANGPDALRFLLQDARFPRSVAHCLRNLERALDRVPDSPEPRAAVADARELVDAAKVRTLAWDGLGEFIDELQIRFAAVDACVHRTYFHADALDEPRMRATA